MRKVFSFLVLSVIVLFTANCGDSNSPAGIQKAIYTQLQQENYEKAVELMVEHLDVPQEQKAQLGLLLTSDKMKAEMEKNEGKNKIKSFEVISEEISEDGLSATVEMKIVTNDGEEKTEKSNFVKKDGKWLMKMDK